MSTLVVAGDSETLIPPVKGGTFADAIPGAEFRTIEGARPAYFGSGHPNETFSAVAEFQGEKG